VVRNNHGVFLLARPRRHAQGRAALPFTWELGSPLPKGADVSPQDSAQQQKL
jgi:hypothetical protein